MPKPGLIAPLRRWDPEQIGGYVLIGRLGAGAMGRVYLGRSTAGRLVAVKTIKIELADEPDFRTRFAQEVAAARRVSGAFTAAVVAADPEADVPWLATAYVPAPSLSTLVRACGPLPVSAVRWLAAGCAEALESIHGAGLVHRDLKPSNVLVSPDGPRVIDFGVARATERIQLTVTRGAVGTPAYMAPEQARDTRNATTASDVFSLGATMLFGATGHAPYQGETVMDVLVRLATEPPDLTGLPPDLADIVTACLDRDPRRRPSSALVLARLAPAVRTDGSLPGSALALIEEYRQDPKPSAPAGADSAEEATFGSLAADWGGPGRRSASSRRSEPGREVRAGPRNWSLSRGLLASAVAAIILIAAGAGIGVAVAGSRRPPPLGPLLPPPPPPPQAAAAPGGRPQIGVNQIQGDSQTVFIVHGQGYPPRRPVTVTLAGVHAPPAHPVADGAGTFNYAINQAHEFFAGGLPVGTYEVVVTGPGGSRAVARFTVLRR